MNSPQLNLTLAWLWLLLGFGSGLALGLGFHRENWLGGYSSLKRRLYRLAHISFFGLGVVNLCFYVTARMLGASGPRLLAASWCFVAGAILMPICCLIMAHVPRSRLLFALPVLSLLAGGLLTLGLVRSNSPPTSSSQPGAIISSNPEPTNHSSQFNLHKL
jgi:hypothetical protein